MTDGHTDEHTDNCFLRVRCSRFLVLFLNCCVVLKFGDTERPFYKIVTILLMGFMVCFLCVQIRRWKSRIDDNFVELILSCLEVAL